MPYVRQNVDELDGEDRAGSGQCVALVQVEAHAPHTSNWTEGDTVKGHKTIVKGTAIATFVDGKYASKAHGNHAAFYLGQSAAGIVVLDQWLSDKKPTISKRTLSFKGKNKDGTYIDPSNNADAFSIIE